MNIYDLNTPVYVIDEGKLIDNLEILKQVEERAGCKILLAQKAFSAFCTYPLIGRYISGTTASGLYEARLGREEMNKENHVFSPAYRQEEMRELVKLCDHIIFNSPAQLMQYKDMCLSAGVSIGIRINPECSTQEGHAIYDPCASGSRLGMTAGHLARALAENESLLDGVEGVHFHTLCEQNADALETTLDAVLCRFGTVIEKMKWMNFGGGHHITRQDYNIDKLIQCVMHVRQTYGLSVYLEPGEAVALNAGYLVTQVMDKVENGITTLILDASAACHMPDVLEMPYTPPLRGAIDDNADAGCVSESGMPARGCTDRRYLYRLSSRTCLAGDIIGDYYFNREIQTGDKLVFEDMAIYSMVKNNTFNGMPLPDIAVMDSSGECRVVRSFGYDDFKQRLS